MISRQDLQMVGGQTATFEWTLYQPDGDPYDLTGDTVEIYISRGSGLASHLKKTSLPGTHYDAVGGKVRATLSATEIAAARVMRIWWYEVWRIPVGQPTVNKPHIVGELKIVSSVRI